MIVVVFKIIIKSRLNICQKNVEEHIQTCNPEEQNMNLCHCHYISVSYFLFILILKYIYLEFQLKHPNIVVTTNLYIDLPRVIIISQVHKLKSDYLTILPH